MNSAKPTEPDYDDPDYYLPGDTSVVKISCFRLGADATRLLVDGTGISLKDLKKRRP